MTPVIPDTNNPDFNYHKHISFRPVTAEVLKYLMEGRIQIELFGIQMPIRRDLSMSTRELIESEKLAKSQISALNNNQKVIDMGKIKYEMEAEVLRKRQIKVEQKLAHLREIVKYGEQRGLEVVSIKYIKGILDAPTNEKLDKWLKSFQHLGTNEINGNGGRNQEFFSEFTENNRIQQKSRMCVIS